MTVDKTLTRAINNLRYGTVVINTSPGISYFIGMSPWGGHPGSTYTDIQSGNSYVNNPNMFENVEKSVLFTPFRVSPRPFFFVTGRVNLKAYKAFAQFSISNKWMDLVRLLKAAIFN